MSLCDKSPADRFKRWQRKAAQTSNFRWLGSTKLHFPNGLNFIGFPTPKCVCLDLIRQPGAHKIHTGPSTQELVLAQGGPRPKPPSVGSKLHLSHSKDVPCRSKLRLFIGHNIETLNAIKYQANSSVSGI